MDREKLEELEKTLHLEKNILRYLLTKPPTNYEPKKYHYTLPVRRKKREAEGTPEEEKIIKKVSKSEPVPSKAPEVAPEVAEKVAAETIEKPKKEQPKLEDIEKKLESIMDNPDIKL